MRRSAIGFAAILLALLILIAGFALWLLYTESGLRWALNRALPLVEESVSIEQASGTLAGPLEIRTLRVQTEGVIVELDRARLQWTPAALLSLRLRLDELDVGQLRIQMLQLPQAEPTTPTPLPQPLLPFGVVIERLQMEQLQFFAASDPAAAAPQTATLDLRKIELQGQLIEDFFRIEPLRAELAPVGSVELLAEGKLLGDGLQLDMASIRGPGQLHASGDLYWIDPRAELDLHWQDLQWPPEQPQIDSAHGQLQLQGPLTALAVNGQARLGTQTDLQIEGTVGEQLDLRTQWQDLRWPLRAESPDLQSPSADLHWRGALLAPTVEGAVQLPGQARLAINGKLDPQQLNLTLDWQQLQWPLVIAQGERAIVRSPQGKVQLRGALEQWQFQLAAALRMPQEQGELAGRLTASGSGNQQQLQTRDLTLQALDGQASGELLLDWAQQQLNSSLLIAQINPAKLAPAWTGALNGQLQAQLRWQQELQLDGSWTLSDSRLRGREFSSKARLQLRGDQIVLPEFSLRSGDSQLQGGGQVWPQLAAQAELDSPKLDDLWPGLQGKAALRFAIDGEPGLPAIEVDGNAQELQIADLRAEELQLKAQFDPDGQLRLDLQAQDLYAREPIDSVQLQARGRMQEHVLNLQVAAPRGALNSEWAGGYDPQQGIWRGEWRSGQLQPRELAAWQLEEPAALEWSAAEARLEPACWGSVEGRLCAQTHWLQQEWLTAWRLENFELAALQPFLPVDWRARGSLTGTGRLVLADGQLSQARVELQTSAGSLAAGPKAKLDFAPSEFRFTESASDGGQAHVALNLPDGALLLEAQIRPAASWAERGLDGQLQADWPDISALALLSPELGEIQGALHGEFALAGTLRRPKLDGELQLQNGQIALITPGITLKELKAKLSADGDERIQLEARARSGDGELKVDGHWALFDTGRQIGLAVRGEQLLAVNTPEAKVWISPDLNLQLEGDQARLSGTVKVPKARITPERFSGGGVGPSPDQVILDAQGQRPDQRGMKLHSQVKLVLGEDVRFDGFGLKTQLKGQIEATDQPGRLTAGRGELRLIGGRYQAYGQDLTIETGRLLFDGGPITNPGLDLRATRAPRDNILVGVQVRGALDAPQLNLFSDPPMSQDQQLSWLVLGRPVDSGTDDAQREAVASAALALGLRGSDFVAGKIGDKLGLDEISIGSKPGQTADQARFTIGKYLSPRLYVSYGVGLFQPGHSVQLEYDLGGGFKLSTETGVESGGDLIYSIEK